MSYESELKLAINAASKAGEFLLHQSDLTVLSNEGRDVKLKADRESETLIMNMLAPTKIPVLAEESGEHGAQDGMRWIVDPLDGTANYFRGMIDLCCVSIALWDGDTPLLGVVNRFATDELFHGKIGDGAWMNDKPIRTSTLTDVSQAVVATGFPAGHRYTDEALLKYVKMLQRFKKVRLLGTAAIMTAYVGAGLIDVYSEEGIMLWDIAAGAAITVAAGGNYRAEPMGNYKYKFRCFANAEIAKVCEDL
ncbi:MAG: hypothetical protein LBU65_01695 [Planctomycetaceae bacterium]|jgi:myo-inositol-1(or 4)-monophosphatase|nr:hypothetical protein [Planctomycetaceae bacterium]